MDRERLKNDHHYRETYEKFVKDRPDSTQEDFASFYTELVAELTLKDRAHYELNHGRMIRFSNPTQGDEWLDLLDMEFFNLLKGNHGEVHITKTQKNEYSVKIVLPGHLFYLIPWNKSHNLSVDGSMLEIILDKFLEPKSPFLFGGADWIMESIS